MHDNYVLVRLNTSEEQLKIKSLLDSAGDDLIVALNLASTTPDWFREHWRPAYEARIGLERRSFTF